VANRRMNLSAEGKEILESLTDSLELERPFIVRIALAKGIATHVIMDLNLKYETKNGWTIPDNIIKDQEFLLFKHLIIQYAENNLTDDELHKEMILYIEHGLRVLQKLENNKSSLEDLRLLIL